MGKYTRHGTTSLCMVCEPLAGRRHVFVRAQRKRVDFAAVSQTLCDELYPAAEKIVLVMDQLDTHGVASLYAAFSAPGSAAAGRAAGDPLQPQAGQLAEPG